MDNVDGPQVSSASPLPSTTPSPTLILLCIVSSAALVSLALLIQSDSPFIRTIQHAGSRLWDRIGSDIWQTSSTSSSTASNSNKQQQHATGHGRSPSQSSSKKGKTIKGGKRKVVIAKDVDMSNIATGSQSRRRAGNSGTGATSTPSQQSNPSVSPAKPTVSKAIRQTSATSPSARSTPSPKKLSLLPTPATSPATEQPEPTTPTRPAAARTLSNTIFHTILNPRAAAYEFRAQYYNLPHDPSTTNDATSTTTQTLDHANPSSTGLPEPALATTSAPSDGTTPYETSGAVSPTPVGALQPYDAFLVLDVEATCEAGSRFDHPNEIIEWPVILMKWEDRDETTGTASKLVIVDEFTSFVRPTWRPQLSEFCTSLTGITQADIDPAPTFPEMLTLFEQWLQKHNLIPPPTALLTPPQSRCPSPTPFEFQNDNEDTVPLPSYPEPSSSASPLVPADTDGLTPPDLSGSASPPPATAPDLSTFSPALSTSSLSSPAPSFAFSARASQRTSQSSFGGWNAQQFLGPSVGEGYLGMDAENDWDNYAPPGTMSRFAWCTDGPFDLRDFLVKQCFISGIAVPDYFLGDVIDIRRVVGSWVENASRPATSASRPSRLPHQRHGKRPSLNIPQQLQALALGHFTGKQHRGIDDARNLCRIMESLASRNVSLEANMFVNPNRRWYWMGRDGVVYPPIQA